MEWIQEWVRILHSIHQKPHIKWEGKHPEVTAGSPDSSLRIQIMAGLGSTLGMHPRLHRTRRERHPTYPARFRTQAVTLLFPCKSTLPLCFTEYLWKGNMQSLCHKHVTLHTNIIRRKIYLDLPIISELLLIRRRKCASAPSPSYQSKHRLLPSKASNPPLQFLNTVSRITWLPRFGLFSLKTRYILQNLSSWERCKMYLFLVCLFF